MRVPKQSMAEQNPPSEPGRAPASALVAGLLAGFLATVPMTAVMISGRRRLPPEEQYALPPREIVDSAAEKTGAAQEMDETERREVTALAHFGFGAAAGGAYGVLAERVPGPAALKGITWGLLVWSGSYLGWIPAAGILRPATEHPARRNALMIGAHVVWGAVTGLLLERLTGRGRQQGD